MLGWAARLSAGVILPYADVRMIPGQGLLDGLIVESLTLEDVYLRLVGDDA